MALSRDNWVEAALTALAASGLAGVAVEPLARALHATKGSFYWHFADRAALIRATLERWEERETTEVIERINVLSDARSRLAALGAGAYASAARGNAHAAVLAAAADPLVEPVLRRVTQTRLAFLQAQYEELGSSRQEAAQLARLAYALYLGIADLRRADPAGEPTGDALRSYLDLAVTVMLAPADRRPGDAGGLAAGHATRRRLGGTGG